MKRDHVVDGRAQIITVTPVNKDDPDYEALYRRWRTLALGMWGVALLVLYTMIVWVCCGAPTPGG
jgi:hypothetical protein